METREGSPETFECGLDRFIRDYEISLGQKGWSSYGEGGRGMRSCRPTTYLILGPPGIGFSLSHVRLSVT